MKTLSMGKIIINAVKFPAVPIVVFLSLLMPPAACGDNQHTSYRWEGQIHISIEENGDPAAHTEGRVALDWNIYIKLKELRRVPVRNSLGLLVGEFVELGDAGTTVTLEGGGIMRHTDPAGRVDTNEYSYNKEGGWEWTSKTDTAWIYYRYSAFDPLKGVLPNGAYFIHTTSPVFAHAGTDTYTDPSGHTSILPALEVVGTGIGRLFTFPLEDTEEVRAEEVKKNIFGVSAGQTDTVVRQIKDHTMSGSLTFTRHLTPYIIKTSETWTIKGIRNIHAVLYTAPYEFRPKGGSESSTVQINASITKPEDAEGKFRFTLYEVSSEKGYAMNAGDDTGPDFEFEDGQAGFEPVQKTGSGWRIETQDILKKAQVTVKSLDYGAWCKLKAEVNVDGKWYPCVTKDGKGYITIPFDKDENHIADMWEDHFDIEGQPADGDNDTEPKGTGDGQPGDGFSNYEEYRGFIVNGEWDEWQFNPKYKDLFIYDEIGLGIGDFWELKLRLHLIDKDEYAEDRTVNFNRGYGTAGRQKGLYLKQGELPPGLAGRAWPCVGTPNVVDEVVIDEIISPVSAIKKHPESPPLYLYSVIAHELGHGVDIRHHGEDDYAPDNTAVWGGCASGNTSCVMRYDHSAYLYYIGWDGKRYDYPEDELGHTFCTGKAGTGINAREKRRDKDGRPYPVAGPAVFGRCKQSVTLKGEDKWGIYED